ncbi:MAG: hypothetical protein V3T23_09520, partial [Nitrososphaerales archaeon]
QRRKGYILIFMHNLAPQFDRSTAAAEFHAKSSVLLPDAIKRRFDCILRRTQFMIYCIASCTVRSSPK